MFGSAAMAEAEDVITDVARHATVYTQALWRRHRPAPPGPAVLQLADVAQRLDLLIAAALGRRLVLRTAQEPARPTVLARWFQRAEPPHERHALSATDGHHIWLPANVPAVEGVHAAAEHYRALALVQAMRAVRGAPMLLEAKTPPLVYALFSLLEAHAADDALLRSLPGMAAPLARLRQTALAQRPAVSALPAHLQPLERLLRAVLSASAAKPVSLDDAGLRAAADEDSAASPWLMHLPASAAETLARARALAPQFAPTAAFARQRRFLWRDIWLGELLPTPAHVPGMPGDASATSDDEASAAPGPTRSAHLPRRPQVRKPIEDEDREEPQGAWMVQTAQPHEIAEDPMGMQRPSDRDTTTAAEEFADALSEMPEARLVSTPGRPKEVLLSDDPPDRLARSARNQQAGDATTALHYPEWDYQTESYRHPGATVLLGEAATGPQAWLQATLDERRGMLQAVRRRFELLRSRRVSLRRQHDGDDIDLEAYTEARADFSAGLPLPQRLYRAERRIERDLALLVLVDVSGSTDSWVAPGRRVIDVAREALLVVSIALDGMRAPFAVQAFSGEGPDGVVVRSVKRFDEAYGTPVALRIAGLEPENYTRAGAALRHAASTLMREPAEHRLVLLLSDGKPNDVDAYDGRYGVEDMRQAVTEARLQGIAPFCLTIDRQAASYLPAVFGPHHYALLSRPERLPELLLDWLRRLVTR